MKIQLNARIPGLDHEIWDRGRNGIEQVGKRALHVQVDAVARDVRGERSFQPYFCFTPDPEAEWSCRK